MSTELQCLYCSQVIDSKITINASVAQMRQHVKIQHPGKPKF